MIKTLFLAYVHGFKGGENTFKDFPTQLKNRIAKEIPERTVVDAIYPRYETQGTLPDAVIDFREWLNQEVLEREKEAGNNQPTKDPTIGVILIAHSMGGMLVADTLFSILDEKQTPKDTNPQPIFPCIQGMLTFDTPFCGLSRSMFAYGAFAQYQNVSNAYGLASSVYALPSAVFSRSGTTAAESSAKAATAAGSNTEATQEKPTWRFWQSVAMQTGAAGAIAAAGAAAYMNRDSLSKSWASMNKESLSSWFSSSSKTSNEGIDEKKSAEPPLPETATEETAAKASAAEPQPMSEEDSKSSSFYSLSPSNLAYITQSLSLVSKDNINTGLAYMSRENLNSGFKWLSSHLQFVSALVQGSELQSRIMRISNLEGIGFADLYVSLGPNDVWSGGYFVAERTFCSIPPEGTKASKFFIKQVNKKAKDEVVAHISMFRPDRNEGFEQLCDTAAGLCVSWANTHGDKGLVDNYRIAHKHDVDYKKLTRYTYSQDGGFKEVPMNKGSSWGLGSLTGGAKNQEKKDVPKGDAFTRYVYDKENVVYEVTADGKRIVLSKTGEVLKEEPLANGEAKAEENDKPESNNEQVEPGRQEVSTTESSSLKQANGEKAGEEEQVDLEDIPGVTQDLDCKS